MYCAIIGDIVGSKKIKDRGAVQSLLNDILNEINVTYKKDIQANFLVTLGDEFQGLLSHPRHLLAIVETIRLRFYPYTLRIGIGFGDLATKIIRDHAIGADGPAYYAARACIKAIKDKNNKYEQGYQDIKLGLYEGDVDMSLLNTSLALATYISRDWTKKQVEVIRLISSEAMSQREIGHLIGLDQSSVQRRLTSSGYFSYKQAMTVHQACINDIWEEINV